MIMMVYLSRYTESHLQPVRLKQADSFPSKPWTAEFGYNKRPLITSDFLCLILLVSH